MVFIAEANMGRIAAALVLFGLALAQTLEVASGEARYRVKEELFGVGLTDAVGTTKEVKGQVAFRNGRWSGRLVVNLESLKSDQARRDNYLRQNTFQTARFPEAVFVPVEVKGLPNPWPREGRLPVEVLGDLTIRDVTQRVSWKGEAEFRGSEVRVQLQTAFPFELFNLTQPRVPIVLSVENNIRLEVEIVFRVRP
jgi:polyisoprenoid-binding protein YceI